MTAAAPPNAQNASPATEVSTDPVRKEIPLSHTAKVVAEKRYLRRDEEGNVCETVYDMFKRVADNIASGDKLYGATDEQVAELSNEFLEMMVDLEFLAGMTLRNAGRELQQLSACYVLPMEDSMDSIYTTLKNAAKLHKTGAGIGYDFSKLRPKGAEVKTTGGRSCGPVGFMKLIEFSCDTIVNSAATRRAGNMGILRIDHPDIDEFLACKEDNSQLNNFNISVNGTDAFMNAVKEGTTYDIIDPHSGKVLEKRDAKAMFRKICQKAWRSAEPGMIFFDEVNRFNPTPQLGPMTATNQCGEQPLFPYEACNLGSIVLNRMVMKTPNGNVEIDWDKLENRVQKAVHFLDNTIDLNNYALEELKKMNHANRRIGLGVMGFADLLIELGIPYNSEEGVKTAEVVMKFIQDKSHEESRRLARERGSFPNFKGSRWEKIGYPEMRNATVTTIAPTGTTSIFAGCSSGIEPIFSLVFVRKNILDQDKDSFIEVHPLFEEKCKQAWIYSEELMEEVSQAGSLESVKQIPAELKRVFVTSHDIAPKWHVKIQAAFQKHTDNAVSKTVNMPNSSTLEDVEEVYLMAYETKCKGVTVYRDGSRDKQVLNLVPKKESKTN
jgi:ribonucleoside-diphosphate reductase alpha chain